MSNGAESSSRGEAERQERWFRSWDEPKAKEGNVSDRLFAWPRLLAWTAAVVSTGALLGCGLATAAVAGASTSSRAPVSLPVYLFSIPTASGSLTGRGDKHLTLRLVGTRDYLTRFTDRPLRQAFVVANVNFVKRFRGYFGRSRPNAVLTYTPEGSRIPVSIVLTIGQPRWNARRASWTFPATRIRKQPDNLPGSIVHIKPPWIANPRSFNQATLFIDDSATVINGCVIQPQTSCPGLFALNANLSGAYLMGANLSGAFLGLANLTGAGLTSANLTGANLTEANLTGAVLADGTLSNAILNFANFTGANLEGAILGNAQLNSANFTGANLGGAQLNSANFTGANLTGAILGNAQLNSANLTGANLTDANLTGANLTGANLTGANLIGDTFNGVTLAGAVFCNTTMPDRSVNYSGC
jgi:uncharacterized protein YjbI with pentapeptide repeats